ncbi:MAG: hypothetical protein IKE43_00475 [Coriobacteriales bacterium]|nr:hypothetical protein [Coriobacteriales bacterium]
MKTFDYSSNAQVTILTSCAGQDAVQGLISHVERMVKDTDACPQDVLVLTASSTIATDLRNRLASQQNPFFAEITIATPRDLALELLNSAEAFDITHRRARVLYDFELSFLNEDIKVFGKQGRRIKEMLKFLERGWSEMREEEDGWLITGEERSMETFLKEHLALLEALHPSEVEAVCMRYLRASASALEQAAFNHVFVLGARSMGRAAQILACNLAKENLVVEWNTDAALLGDGPYAYADGLQELMRDNPQHTCINLDAPLMSGAVLDILNNLFAARKEAPHTNTCEFLPGTEGSFAVINANRLDHEMSCVVNAVQEHLSNGDQPEQIFVATPNDAWTRRVSAVFAQAEIPYTSIEERQVLTCDVRDAAKSAAARVVTALMLAQNPQDCMAWRAWCGFGDYLTCSGGFATLFENVKASGTGLVAELDALVSRHHDNSLPKGLALIAEKYLAGCAFIEQARGLAGEDLIKAACMAATGLEELPHALKTLFSDTKPHADASLLCTHIYQKLMRPPFDRCGVKIGSWERVNGLAPQTVIMSGMVNGLVPESAYFDLTLLTLDARAKKHEQLLERMIATVSSAKTNVICTTFSECTLIEAETLKLDSNRIKLVDRERICTISPSITVRLMQGVYNGE